MNSLLGLIIELFWAVLLLIGYLLFMGNLLSQRIYLILCAKIC